VACPGLAGALLAAEPAAFQASSPGMPSGKPIEAKFSAWDFCCTRQNVSPAASWRNSPAGATASLTGVRVKANALGKTKSTGIFGR
jgi:hypothetical protein